MIKSNRPEQTLIKGLRRDRWDGERNAQFIATTLSIVPGVHLDKCLPRCEVQFEVSGREEYYYAEISLYCQMYILCTLSGHQLVVSGM